MQNTSLVLSDPPFAHPLSLPDGSGSLGHAHNTQPGPDEEAALGITRIGEYQVGFGAYSDIWKAKMTRDGVTLPVALKVLRLIVSETRLGQREARERNWTLLEHDHVSPLYATYRQPNGAPVFVSPWYENGTAKEHLNAHPDINAMKIIIEIASGVEYLHDKSIIHGDLKSSNVLIDDNGHARLIDFGLSRLVDAQPGLTTCTPTTLRWCAPELLRSDNAHPTMCSDVYSFASTALELLTGSVPYDQLGDRAVALQILMGVTPRSLTNGLKYSIPRVNELWDLLDQCWAEPDKRPSISFVRARLSTLQ